MTFNIKKPQIVQGAIKNYFLGGSTGDTVQLSTSVFGNTNDNQIGTWELYGSTDARDISQTKAFSIFLIYLDYNNKITYDFIVGHFIVDPKTDDVKIATNTFDQFELVDDTLYSQYLKENSGVSGLLTYQQVENEIKYFKNAIFSNVN